MQHEIYSVIGSCSIRLILGGNHRQFWGKVIAAAAGMKSIFAVFNLWLQPMVYMNALKQQPPMARVRFNRNAIILRRIWVYKCYISPQFADFTCIRKRNAVKFLPMNQIFMMHSHSHDWSV